MCATFKQRQFKFKTKSINHANILNIETLLLNMQA